MPIFWGTYGGPWWVRWVSVGGLWLLWAYGQGVDPAIVGQANNPGNF